MKIALLVHDLGIGGVAQFIFNLGTYLAGRGHAVIVVATEEGTWWGRLADTGMTGVCLPIGRWESRVQHTRRVARYLTGAAFGAVLSNIHVKNRTGQRSLAFLPEQMLRCVVLHNDAAGIYRLAAVNRDVWDAAVAVSPGVQQEATARFPRKQIRYIPYGIPCPTDAQLAQRATWSSPLRLLYVGRLKDAQKGIYLLPSIVRECIQQQLPVTLTIIGDGADREALEHEIAAKGVAHLVELRGAQSTANVYQTMQAHHVLLLPSNFEGLPLVLLEAQANGCVPLASHLPGITDAAIEEGVSGLLAPPGDATAFARQIATLAEPGRWQTFSQAAIRRAREHFSTEIMGERYHFLLGELAADAARLAQVRGRPDSLNALFRWQDFIPSRLHRLRQELRR